MEIFHLNTDVGYIDVAPSQDKVSNLSLSLHIESFQSLWAEPYDAPASTRKLKKKSCDFRKEVTTNLMN